MGWNCLQSWEFDRDIHFGPVEIPALFLMIIRVKAESSFTGLIGAATPYLLSVWESHTPSSLCCSIKISNAHFCPETTAPSPGCFIIVLNSTIDRFFLFWIVLCSSYPRERDIWLNSVSHVWPKSHVLRSFP